jgi:hypothetical protein
LGFPIVEVCRNRADQEACDYDSEDRWSECRLNRICVAGLAGIKYALPPAANAKKPIIRLFAILSRRGILPSTCNPSQEAGLPTNDCITVLASVFEAEQGNADFIVQLLVAGN